LARVWLARPKAVKPSITEPFWVCAGALRKGVDFTLYRGQQHGNRSRVLVVAPTAEQPSPQGIRRLEHEYSLAAELDPAWASRWRSLVTKSGRFSSLPTLAVSPWIVIAGKQKAN
jgi:hypothetical protein